MAFLFQDAEQRSDGGGKGPYRRTCNPPARGRYVTSKLSDDQLQDDFRGEAWLDPADGGLCGITFTEDVGKRFESRSFTRRERVELEIVGNDDVQYELAGKVEDFLKRHAAVTEAWIPWV